LLQVGEPNNAAVRAVRARLNELGCGAVPATGAFDAALRTTVKLFQSRFPDTDGQPLKVDGVVGPISWAALFGALAVPTPSGSPPPLLAAVLDVARTQIGVMEKPPGSNRGPEVDEYLRGVGLDPTRGSFAWCVAFVYFCFGRAASQLGRANPMVRTAGVLDHWNKAGQRGIPRLLTADAVAKPQLVKPGQIFVISVGGGSGHTGLVEDVSGGKLVTIEGNTNDGGSHEGIGVFRRDQRKINSINRGFIDYGKL
jgi:hypothetical protein